MPEVPRALASTELRNPSTVDLDLMSSAEILHAMNQEDATVAAAVSAALPQIARLVDEATHRYRAGGSIHYFGAGTSGRLAVLDAAELVPTFSVDPLRFRAHHAGGPTALTTAMEDVEDDEVSGRHDAGDVAGGDIALGLTASGSTPYVLAALSTAHDTGAFTALVTCNREITAPPCADLLILVDTGPEVLTGSTRLKAGTAQKLVLNMFSTALMVRLGHTYSNLMVDLSPSNGKLRSRLTQIVVEATDAPLEACRAALDAAGGDVRVAIVSLQGAGGIAAAREVLRTNGGDVRTALAAVQRENTK